MSIIQPEIEFVDRSTQSIRYLEHGWPTDLCRWHSHEEYELHFIAETRGKAFVGDYIGDFAPGTLYLIGPNLPHNWVTDDVWTHKVETRDMLVQFSQSSFDALLKGFPEFSDMRCMLTLSRSGIELVGFNPTFARGHMEAVRDARGPERIVAFLRLMVRANEHVEKKVLSVIKMVQTDGNGKQARIGEAIDFVVNNFSDKISVDRAANIAGMSPTTFSRNFQSTTGHKFVEFVNRIRIGQACGILFATDAPVSTICFDVGFQNLANFNRHFLKMKNMTPTEYRNTAQTELVPSGGVGR